MPEDALTVDNLSVEFRTAGGTVHAVRDLSFSVPAGGTLALVGESGSGKSATGLAIMSLLPPTGVAHGRVLIGGQDMLTMPERARQQIRGNEAALIFQDSLTALSPYNTLGKQIGDAYLLHHPKATRREARERAVDMLGRVGIPDASRRSRQYPHEFSGGMRQRAMIAMAVINNPRLLVADEPTTALDVTVQAQILDLLAELQSDFGTAIVLITHDMGVVAETADQVLVMYASREVESGSLTDVFQRAAHPYTVGLQGAMPRLSAGAGTRLTAIPGTPASGDDDVTGCPFQPRCGYAELVGADCLTVRPRLAARDGAEPAVPHRAACHIPNLSHAEEAV